MMETMVVASNKKLSKSLLKGMKTPINKFSKNLDENEQKTKLIKASKYVRDHSMIVNAEFDKIENQ